MQHCATVCTGITGNVDIRWLKRFCKRHEGLSVRKRNGKSITEDRKFSVKVAEGYISRLQKLKTRGLLEDPHLIFNADESAFKEGCKTAKVVGLKGKRIAGHVKGRLKSNTVT